MCAADFSVKFFGEVSESGSEWLQDAVGEWVDVPARLVAVEALVHDPPAEAPAFLVLSS